MASRVTGSRRGAAPKEKQRGAANSRHEFHHEDGAAPAAPAQQAPAAIDEDGEPELIWEEPEQALEDVGDDASALQDLELDGEPDDVFPEAQEDFGPILDLPSDATSPSNSLPALSGVSVPAIRARHGNGPLDTFFQEMGRYPLLSAEEERELTMRYYEHRDPIALRKLVVHNLRLVVKMAYRYRRTWVNVLDLIQEGNVGLVEAVQRFDPFKGAKFSTYATFWIRAYILRYVLEHSRTVRISRTRVGRKLFFQLARERARLSAQGIEPGPKLLAERLGVNQEDLEEVARHMDQPEVRLDAPLLSDDASAGTVLDSMSARDQASPEAEAYWSEFSDKLGSALDAFARTLSDPREVAAWSRHLMSDDPVSLARLGEEFGVTKQRMGQIVNGLRARLKEHLIQTLGTEVELGYNFDGE